MHDIIGPVSESAIMAFRARKSLARCPGAIVFSSRATKMYHGPHLINTGLPRNVPSSCVRAAAHFYNRGRAEKIMWRSHTKMSWESHLIECH